ncbi:MAG: hypothetical protein H7067_04340 [Burkholderiales bacterium]|nr:hypothetical protein [Opitutaceae bacterium]
MTTHRKFEARWVGIGRRLAVAVGAGLLFGLAPASAQDDPAPITGTRATVSISLTINQTRGLHYLTDVKRQELEESGRAIHEYVVNPTGFSAESALANYYAVKKTGTFRSFGRDPETGDLLYLPVQYVEQYDTIIATTRYVTADFLRTLIAQGVIPENLPADWTRAHLDAALKGYSLQAVRFPTSSESRLFFFAIKTGKTPVFVGCANANLSNGEIPVYISLMESGQAFKESYKATLNIRQTKNAGSGQYEESYAPLVEAASTSVKSHCSLSIFPFDIDGSRMDLAGRMTRSSAFNASIGVIVDGAASLSGIIGSRVGYDERSESLAAIAQVEGGVSIGKSTVDKNMGAYLLAVPEALRPVIEIEEEAGTSSASYSMDNVAIFGVAVEAVGSDGATSAP